MSKQTTEMAKRSGTAQAVNPEPKEVETLAYQLWLERGTPTGDDQSDWFRAEEQLRSAEPVQRAA